VSRPRSLHVAEVKAALIARLHGGFAHPGGRFLSTRAVAQRFSVSYQTAHRLLAELETEGFLQRRAASGSYLPGRSEALRSVQLIFHPRAKRKGSFGARLHELLAEALKTRHIPFVRSWTDVDDVPRLRHGHYPVIWECRVGVTVAATQRRFALCLNDRPPVGLGASYIDAVTTDDYSGGACAAELLKSRTGRDGGFAVLGGPEPDLRSRQRIAGFCAHVQDATVTCAQSWFLEAGLAEAEHLLRAKPNGIFACNDRLAEALITHCRKSRVPLPPLVGFDNAPVAEHLRLTTIGIPWQAMVSHAVTLIAARLEGNAESARLVSLSHEPILRLTA